jgi:eukaryotic-like serine/threonine-protein kinase
MRIALAPAYRALRVLQRNGAVSVYDAWSEERGCRCVLKRAGAGPLHSRERRALAREGRLLLSLSHPHIVRAYELQLRPRCVLVLETLPGETLAYAIRARGPLALGDLAHLGLQLCSALRYLHARGVLHLDLKPSNVVCHGGIARLIDLGISRPPGRAPAGVGSPPYLAPEQARGGPLSPATDVFGLGALLYECIAGKAPFRRSTAGFYEQLRRRARLGDSGVPVPAQLARIVDASLDPDPGARPGVEDVVATLKRFRATR